MNFNNKFNSKKHIPLVEIVSQSQDFKQNMKDNSNHKEDKLIKSKNKAKKDSTLSPILTKSPSNTLPGLTITSIDSPIQFKDPNIKYLSKNNLTNEMNDVIETDPFKNKRMNIIDTQNENIDDADLNLNIGVDLNKVNINYEKKSGIDKEKSKNSIELYYCIFCKRSKKVKTFTSKLGLMRHLSNDHSSVDIKNNEFVLNKEF